MLAADDVLNRCFGPFSRSSPHKRHPTPSEARGGSLQRLQATPRGHIEADLALQLALLHPGTRPHPAVTSEMCPASAAPQPGTAPAALAALEAAASAATPSPWPVRPPGPPLASRGLKAEEIHFEADPCPSKSHKEIDAWMSMSNNLQHLLVCHMLS